MGALDVSDIELGRMVGETRQTIHRKKTGRSALTADNISDYAAALGIDPDVLMRRPSAAIAWLAQHRSEQLDALELPPGRQGELDRPGSPIEQKGGECWRRPVRHLTPWPHKIVIPNCSEAWAA